MQVPEEVRGLPHYDQYNHNPDEYRPRYSKRERIGRVALIAGASVAATVGSFAAQNPELVQSTVAAALYKEPEKGDIIPELTGCPSNHANVADLPVGNSPALTSENFLQKALNGALGGFVYNPELDQAYQDVKDRDSLSRSFGETSVDEFIDSERLFWPFNNYFDKKLDTYNTSNGLEMRFFMHEGDVEFAIDPQAIEQMISDIFDRPEIYDNPEVRDIIECKRRQIIEQRMLNGNIADVNVSANGDKGLEGNNVVTFSEEAKDSHSAGLGISGIATRFLNRQLTPDHMMIVTGGNRNLEPNQQTLNRRFLHELIHILIFQDLSDTIAESTEQERLVKYIERALLEYYNEYGRLPLALVIIDSEEL